MLRLLFLLVAVSASHVASAQPGYFNERIDGKTLDGWAQLELRFNQVDAFSVDDLQTKTDQRRWQGGLARVGLRYVPTSSIELVLAGELRSNVLWGDETRFGLLVDENVFRQPRDDDSGHLRWSPRALMATAVIPIGRISCGHQAIHWGAGMLVNDGAQTPEFGDAWSASLVERCVFATKPFSSVQDLAVFVAGDLVWRDENAELLDGDRALGATLGWRFKNKALTVGQFVSYRHQTDRDDPLFPLEEATTASVLTTDLYFKWRLLRRGNQTLTWEGEGALISGETTRPYLEETYADGADVLAMGGLTRFKYEGPRLSAKLETGYASGDDDTRDNTVRVFSMHSSHQVGMLLFDQVLPMVTARSADRLMDRDLVAVPPPSTRFTVAQGGVTNAWYLNPVIRLKPFKSLEVRLGYVYARSAADFLDLYQTGITGGYNTTVGGQQPGGRTLGHEIDLGIHYTFFGQSVSPTVNRLRMRAAFEAANWLPGNAFNGVIDEPLYMMRLAFGLGW